MNESDISYYAGHGRYGSGPDFDMNYEVLLEGRKDPISHEGLEAMMKSSGKTSGRSAWEEFQWQLHRGKVRVTPKNQGNILINQQPHHQSEFGSRLQYWALNELGQKPTPATGQHGTLGARDSDRRYHLWVFDGCRTVDYEKNIRRTPHQGNKQTDIIDTTRTVYDLAPVFGAFLESVLAQHSAEQVITQMEDANLNAPQPVMHGSGYQDDPVVP